MGVSLTSLNYNGCSFCVLRLKRCISCLEKRWIYSIQKKKEEFLCLQLRKSNECEAFFFSENILYVSSQKHWQDLHSVCDDFQHKSNKKKRNSIIRHHPYIELHVSFRWVYRHMKERMMRIVCPTLVLTLECPFYSRTTQTRSTPGVYCYKSLAIISKSQPKNIHIEDGRCWEHWSCSTHQSIDVFVFVKNLIEAR